MNISFLYQIYRQHPVVSTDSRNCPQGCIFFALKGDRFDGNDYITQVLEQGAAYAVGDRSSLPADERIVIVDDVLQTLQELAAYHRRQLKTPVIAITGTNGKTTTKELMAAALGRRYNVLYTQGNLNNHIGVPLTLLRLRPEHDYAVVEMGANHPGEIASLCIIADPDCGLITNVGKAHLEGFGSFEGVIRTKVELYEYLQKKGKFAFANKQNAMLAAQSTDLKRIFYGTSDDCYVQGVLQQDIPTVIVRWQKKAEETGFMLTTRLVGGYNFENILAAITVASYFGVDAQQINEGLAAYQPTNNRSQLIETMQNRLIVDAYNANPDSMGAALTNFIALDAPAKTVILGEMGELGDYSRDEHQKIVETLLGSSVENVFLVGQHFRSCQGLLPAWSVFPTTDELIEHLQSDPIEGQTILVKGSRKNQLERTIAYL